MVLLEISYLNQSAFLNLRLPIYICGYNGNIFFASFNDFSLLFPPNAIQRNDKVVEEIFWQHTMKNTRKMQILKISANFKNIG